MGLAYAMGIKSQTVVWLPGAVPLPPRAGRRRTIQRAAGNEPVSVQDAVMNLPNEVWQNATWREGGNAPLSSRFCRAVCPFHRQKPLEI